MSILSEVILFSDVEGVVTKDGAPVEGAEIIQEITYQEPGKIPPTSVKTNANGYFALERVTHGPGLGRVLPGQPSILQKLVIKYDGNEYQAWRHSKDSYELNSELDGQPIKLVCELTQAPDFEGKHYGICRVAKD